MEPIHDIQKDFIKQREEVERKYLQSHKNEIDSFIKFCASRGLELSEDNFKYIPTTGVIAEHENILSTVQPMLKRDKEGLVNWTVIADAYEDARGPYAGYLYGANHIAMASPRFRRGHHFGNNWSPRFIDLFWALDKSELDAYIALDFNRVRINLDNSYYMESDTWFGAPYKDNILEIKDGIIKLAPPSDIDSGLISFLFNDAYALDIEWYTSGSIKTFQSLELKGERVTVSQDGNDYHPARYLHAEFDLHSHQFRHFDGAIQYLTPDEYFSRRDTDFNHNRKATTQIKPLSEKLFKFNGKIDVEMWKEFASHFFSGNPLIYEYYSGGYPKHLEDNLQKIRSRS